MLVSKKEKRKTKKMKRTAEHSATTTKFLLEKIPTNHFEKRRQLENKERIETKEKKEREEKKAEVNNLVDPASSHMLVSKKERRKTKEQMKRNADHSATTTKFLLGKVATKHIEKRRDGKGKKEKERKKRQEREERKQMN